MPNSPQEEKHEASQGKGPQRRPPGRGGIAVRAALTFFCQTLLDDRGGPYEATLAG
ncbi:hypothetical protein ACFOGG_05010 [Brenneria rubrifaciens]|uniref:hypothetical protein n=1 Tax=Brenneria rubrifaciens TaxID=55213 RepID=UPI00361CD84D